MATDDATPQSSSVTHQARELKGIYSQIATSICLILALCAIYWAIFGVIHAINQRAIYLALTGILCFFYYPFNKNSPQDRFTIFDIILALLSVGVAVYAISTFLARVNRLGLPDTQDYIVGLIAVALGIEMVRRVLGLLLTFLAGGAIAYAYFGPYMPEAIGHRGFDMIRIVSHIFSGMEGVYGIATGVMCSFVLMFILFGAFLERSGISQFIVDVSLALTRRGRGGPAKAAVISSGLMGSISGSAIANVLTTGVFTIPMMKKVGYRSHVSAAIEAAASTGGQIMPPLMGAAAFVMVEFTGISYLKIVVAAAVPAILYFFVIFLFVHIEAVRKDIRVDDTMIDSHYEAWAIIKKEWYSVLPFFVLIFFLFQGYSALTSGFYALISTVLVSQIRKKTRMGIKDIAQTLITGAKYSIVVGSISSTIGIIIAIVGLTGLGLKFSELSVSLSGGNVFITIIFIIVASYVLGMGLPTTPAYIVLAIFAGPSLSSMGVPLLAAHLLMLWYSIDSSISPPVALTAYTAAGVARSDPIKTMFCAFKYAKGLYIIPFLFVYRPGIMLQGSLIEIVITVVCVTCGLTAAVFFLEGFIARPISILERILYVGCAVAFFYNDLISNGAALAGFVLLLMIHWFLGKKGENQLVSQEAGS
jgi:TRAP transporter 4TM/12TM fusion protein